jgi:uncharacterized protein
MIKTVEVINESNAGALLVKAEVADTFFRRLKGLLGRRELPAGRGMLLKPANSIHTIGMKFAIDVIFTDREGTILKIIEKMPPGKISPLVKGAHCVIETAGGELAKSNPAIGDRLVFRYPHKNPRGRFSV